MKSFENLLKIWEFLSHRSMVNREASFKMLALKKGYSQKVVNTFIIRFVRGFFYSVKQLTVLEKELLHRSN